jgi:hypothetical protein
MLSSGSRLRGNRRCKRESVLFVGTQFSILYTSQVNGVMVCGEVVDMLGDNIAGFDPLELVCAYKAVIYDGGDSAPLSLKRVCVVRDSAHVGGSRGVAEARSVVAGDVSFSWGHCSNW